MKETSTSQKGLVFIFDSTPTAAEIESFHDQFVITNSLSQEILLKQKGISSHYLYRESQHALTLAGEQAMEWMATFPLRSQSIYPEIDRITQFGDPPLWYLIMDALFELGGGIFEAFFHSQLIDTWVQWAGSDVRILVISPEDQPLAVWMDQRFGSKVQWTKREHTCLTPNERPLNKKLRAICEKLNRIVVMPLLLRLSQKLPFRSKLRPKWVLLSPLGDMIQPSSGGAIKYPDLYFQNLTDVLLGTGNRLVQVGITPATGGKGTLSSIYSEWKALLKDGFRPWHAYGGVQDAIAALLMRRKLNRQVEVWEKNPKFIELFHWQGRSLYPLLRSLFRERFAILVSSAQYHLKLAKRFVELEKPDRVFSVEAFSNLGRAVASEVHRSGGELWGVQGGIISPLRVTNFGFFAKALGNHSNLLPDRFLVWGEEYRKILNQFGVPDQKLSVIGFTRGDRRLNTAKVDGNLPRKRTVMYLTGGNSLVCPYLMTIEEERVTLELLARELGKEFRFIVRTHPRHDATELSQLQERHPEVTIQSAHSVSIADALLGVDCVIAKASTVLLEASSLGIPIVLVNYAGTPDFTGFDRFRGRIKTIREAGEASSFVLDAIKESANGRGINTEFNEGWCMGRPTEAMERFRSLLQTEERSV